MKALLPAGCWQRRGTACASAVQPCANGRNTAGSRGDLHRRAVRLPLSQRERAFRTTCWPSSLWNFLTLESAMLRDSLLPVSGVIRPDVDAAAAGGGGGSGPGSVGLVPPPPPLDGLRAPSAAGASPESLGPQAMSVACRDASGDGYGPSVDDHHETGGHAVVVIP